jgi:hypothetical protein
MEGDVLIIRGREYLTLQKFFDVCFTNDAMNDFIVLTFQFSTSEGLLIQSSGFRQSNVFVDPHVQIPMDLDLSPHGPGKKKRVVY